MDIVLAGSLDGVQTVHLIKMRLSVPVIFITALSGGVMFERMQVVGPDGIITKPFVNEDLIALIKKVLDDSKL